MKQVEEIAASYDRDYRDGKFGGPGLTHRWILKLLSPEAGKRLLDIGCAQGYLLKEAGAAGLATYGIDISSEAVNTARGNSPSSEIRCADACRLDWEDGYFDYITNIGSLEHFREPALCLYEMRRVMKEDGMACIMLPNLYYYRNVLDKLFMKKEPTSHQLIERFASLGEWSRFIENSGLSIQRVHKYNKFNRPALSRFLRSVFIPAGFSHHFAFICKKK